jgi:hypothetical protein
MVIRVALAAVVVVVLLAAVLLAWPAASPDPPIIDRPVRVTNLPDPVPPPPATDG